MKNDTEKQRGTSLASPLHLFDPYLHRFMYSHFFRVRPPSFPICTANSEQRNSETAKRYSFTYVPFKKKHILSHRPNANLEFVRASSEVHKSVLFFLLRMGRMVGW